MITRINNLLYKYFSYRIGNAKIGIRFKKVSKTRTRPIYIEFLGASGVGKTTLYNEIANKRNKKWMEFSDFIALHALRMQKNGLINIPSYYQDLASYRTQELVEGISIPIDRMDIIGYNSFVLINDFFMYFLNLNHTVVNDDGILHSFTNSLLKLYNINKTDFKEVTKNRVVVYCYNTPERTAEQILKRQKETGYLNVLHKTETLEELVLKQKILLREKRDLISILESFNIPILKIDTSADLESNTKKIQEFIEIIQNK